MALLETHILSYLLLLPAASALLIAFIPGKNINLIRWTAIAGSVLAGINRISF